MTYATTTDLKGKLRLQYAVCYTGATADAELGVSMVWTDTEEVCSNGVDCVAKCKEVL